LIVFLGLIILAAALIAGVAGVLGNAGGAHALTGGFSVFGYHVTGSTGTLFLCGMVVGAAGLFGLGLLLVGARHTSRRGRSARSALGQSRRETAAASQDRDDLIEQRDSARADAASAHANGAPTNGDASAPANGAPPADVTSAPANGSPPADIASAPGNGAPRASRPLRPDDGHWSGLNVFGRRSVPRPADATTHPESPDRQPAPDAPVPANASAPAE
jgi:predicted lipid-binding transport protein (Tim44 family)